MARFLVTGGAGFIGSHLVHALVQRGDSVRVLDNLSTGFRKNIEDCAPSNLEFIEGDISDPETVGRAMRDVDTVFHQAALASVPRSVQQPLDTNRACVTGTLTVLDQARHANVRRVIYAASSSAYGDQPFSSKREADSPAPLSPYAVAKLAGEYYCHAFFRTYGLETVCIRYFNVFGPRQDPNSPYSAVIPLFISRILRGECPVVHGDGHQTRDFTFVGNVVHGNLLAAEAPSADVAGRTFNVANGRSSSLRELLDTINSLLGTNVKAQFGPPRAGDVRDSLADISAARRYLGYDPPFSFEDGLRRTVEYYQSLHAKAQ